MTDLFLLGFFAVFLFFGLKRPFLWVCAYLYVDILAPQKVGFGIITSIQVSLITFAAAFGGWLLLDKKTRPIFTFRQALMLFAALGLIALGLVLCLNRFTLVLSFGGLGLAVLYPFTKRFTYLPQLFLGAAFSWAIPMAFAAETESVPEIAWLLFTTNLLWTVAYDTEYAMCDREDDLKVGIKSTAILFGDLDKVMVGALQVLTLVALWVLGQRLGFTWPWYLGLAGMAAGFAHQQWRIRYREPWPCFRSSRC